MTRPSAPIALVLTPVPLARAAPGIVTGSPPALARHALAQVWTTGARPLPAGALPWHAWPISRGTQAIARDAGSAARTAPAIAWASHSPTETGGVGGATTNRGASARKTIIPMSRPPLGRSLGTLDR